ncbi:hypothetical protein [Streptomyces olivaceoviridis]|uniref:hypothetical protein n=1 Tax=Streptomyces olivaceoviridis TaxID=1921 RepID=UPI0036FE514A
MPHDQLDLDAIDTVITAYQQHPDLGFACCSAHHVADAAAAMADEIRRLRAQRRLLLDNLTRKDAATGAGDKALAEFLGTEPTEPVRRLEDGSTHTVTTLTEAGEACVQQECVAAREEKRLRQEEYSLRAAVEGVLDEVGYLADDERITAEVAGELRARLRDALGLNPPAVVETHVVADDSNNPEHVDDSAARRP